MAIMFMTTTKTDKHTHAVYLNEETGSGRCLSNSGNVPAHEHLVLLGDDGIWYVQPATYESQGEEHIHAITENVPIQTKSKETEDEILSDVKNNFINWSAFEGESIRCGRESYDFYKGDQWDVDLRSTMENDGRPCLTINEVQANVDTIVGVHKEQVTDFQVLPREMGDDKVAEVSSYLLKYVSDRNRLRFTDGDIFRDMVVTGVGYYDVFIDNTENVQGDVIIDRISWDSVISSPHFNADGSDLEGLIKYKVISENKLKSLTDKADKIEKDLALLQDLYGDRTVDGRIVSDESDDYFKYRITGDKKYILLGDYTYYDPYKKEYLLLERWLKTYRDVVFVLDPKGEPVVSLEGWRSNDIAKIKKFILEQNYYSVQGEQNPDSLAGYSTVTRRIPRMRVTVIVGNTVLWDLNPVDVPVSDFHTIPAYCYFIDGYWYGKVEGVKDCQRELNKRTSQCIDLVNKMAGSSWFIDGNTFGNNPQEEENFRVHSAQAGGKFKVQDINNLPQKIEGGRFPSELAELINLSGEKIRGIMNINLSENADNSSTSNFLLKREMKMIGNNFLFDNFSRAKSKVGVLALGLIQRYYSLERIDRILNSGTMSAFTYDEQMRAIEQQTQQTIEQLQMQLQQSSANPQVAQQIQMQIQQVQEQASQQMESIEKPNFLLDTIQNFKNNEDISNYDVIVTESEYSPSSMLGMFATLQSLLERGVGGIDPSLLLQFSPAPAQIKEQAIQANNMYAEQQASIETEKQKTEIKKTLISQGIIPPEVIEEYGIQDQVYKVGIGQGGQPANSQSGTGVIGVGGDIPQTPRQ